MEDFDKLFSSFDLIDEVIYVCDMDTYDLVFCNKKTRELSRPDCHYAGGQRGCKCYKYLQGFDSPCVFCNNEELKHSKRCVWTRKHPLVDKQYLIRDAVITVDGHDYRMELAMEADAMEASLARLQQTLEMDSHLTDCVRRLVRIDEFSASVDAVLQTVMNFYAGERAYLFDFDWKRQVSSNTFEICAPGVSAEIENLQDIPLDDMRFWLDLFSEKSATVIEDLSTIKDDPNRRVEYEMLAPQGISSLIAVPIFIEDELSGFIGVDNPQANFDNTEFLIELTYFIGTELEKNKNVQNLKFMSYHDRLTGACNRNAYTAISKRLEKEAPRTQGVAFLDMNGLKYLNDNFGHEAGDRQIALFASILLQHYPEEKVFRISGDEFVIVDLNVPFESFQKQMQTLKNELYTEHEGIAAIGYVWDDSGMPLRTLRMQAEQFMYSDKQKHYFFDEEAQRSARPRYIDGIVDSLKDETYVMYLQPKYDLETERVYGAEALVRKIGPDGRVIPPIEFIPVLETEHAISFIDFLIFEKACTTLKQWETRGRGDLDISTNFSRSTIAESDFVAHVLEICKRTGVNCSQLTLEVTESSNNVHIKKLTEVMSQLKPHGFKFALDDMGTEYATLEMLELEDIDLVKFDKSLIRRIEHGTRKQVILENLVGLCDTLGMRCIAEGVETREQLEAVRETGCNYIQGYLFGKPMPTEEFQAKFV